jgi:hypothetical protein
MTKVELAKLQFDGVPVPNLNSHNNGLKLFNYHRLDEMLPGMLVGSFSSGDFFFAYLSPWHIADECGPVYDLIIELEAKSVYWTLLVPNTAPDIEALMDNTKFSHFQIKPFAMVLNYFPLLVDILFFGRYSDITNDFIISFLQNLYFNPFSYLGYFHIILLE